MSIRGYIQSLQHKPYQERLRLFKISSIAACILLITAWIAFLRWGPSQRKNSDASLLNSLSQNFDKAKESISDLQSQIKNAGSLQLPENYRAFAVNNATLDRTGGFLTIEFTVSNPSSYILNFTNPSFSNIHLVDGNASTTPTTVKINGQTFPPKVLSRANWTGSMVFPAPKGTEVSIVLRDLKFESLIGDPFEEKLDINIESVRGAKRILLPREEE